MRDSTVPATVLACFGASAVADTAKRLRWVMPSPSSVIAFCGT